MSTATEVTDEQLNEIADTAISDAVAELAHDRMGLAEMLEDELEGLPEDEQEKVVDRLEALLRRYASALANQGASELIDVSLVGDEAVDAE